MTTTALRASSLFVAHIDVVHGCQLRCVGCPNSVLQPKVVPVEPAFFARMLANIDVERIHTLRLFNFGEPLLHKRLSELVAMIPKQAWTVQEVEISTNAQKVHWDDFERVLAANVVTRLVVSADGDGTPDYLDLDSDDDGYSDEEEAGTPLPDRDGDGIPAYRDPDENPKSGDLYLPAIQS